MRTKRIITEQDSRDFFASSISTMDDAIGIMNLDTKNKELVFDFNAVLLLRFEGVYADTQYKYNDSKFDDNFIAILRRCFNDKLTETSEYKYLRKVNDDSYNFVFKIEIINSSAVKVYLVCFKKLLETQEQLSLFSNVIGAGVSMFAGSTWWIDYDHIAGKFYQVEDGPKILGIPVSKDMVYDTLEFQKVRENAREVSPFFDESIQEETEAYERVRNNETDYFGGRTPALTANEEIVWVEAYGKCFIRYPDGRPRFFVAIDIYLSEIFENVNQLETLNTLIDYGLISSDVGVWYHQRHFKEGRYYFTEAYQELMASDQLYKNVSFTDLLNAQITICEELGDGHEHFLHEFRKVHNSIYTANLDKYHLTIPNYKDKDTLQWIDVRGTVIERDQDGKVLLFVGVNVDVTESYNRRIELEQLRIQNERLQLAERLAVKARGLMVWNLETSDIFINKNIFGNHIFSDKMGIPRTSEGLIYFDDLRKTLVSDDRESRRLAIRFLKELRLVIDGKQSSFKGLLVKHRNVQTGEIMFIEHSVERSETTFGTGDGMIGGILLDVTENILYQDQIKYLADYDVLTGIHNRNYFEEYIKNELQSSYTVLIFDLDGLKLTNDAFGHYEGDKSIKLVANLLKEIFTCSLFVSRIGGDEFVVIADTIDYDTITDKANQFEAALRNYNASNPIEVNVSKGGVTVIDNEIPFDKAFVQAENIMYRRKLNSRSSRKSKVLESILETLNAKTEETKDHSDRLCDSAVKTMKALKMTRFSEIEDMTLLAQVHDIGKITIHDDILHRAGPLTTSEYELIKKHCEAGYKIIRNITDSDDVCNGVLFHHERWDGTGYPQGLMGEDIPVFARIISVADSFDAMTHDRIYQRKKTQKEAVDELIRCSGTQFDPKVVKAFLKSNLDIE